MIYILNISLAEIIQNDLYIIYNCIATTVLTYSLFKLIDARNKIIKYEIVIEKIGIILVNGFLIMLIFRFLMKDRVLSDTVVFRFLIVAFIMFISLNVFAFKVFVDTIYEQRISAQNKHYVDSLSSMINSLQYNQKRFHDSLNKIIQMESEDESNSQIFNYISELKYDFAKYEIPLKINSPTIASVIAGKEYLALDKGCILKFNLQTEEYPYQDYQFTNILSLIIDLGIRLEINYGNKREISLKSIKDEDNVIYSIELESLSCGINELENIVLKTFKSIKNTIKKKDGEIVIVLNDDSVNIGISTPLNKGGMNYV